MSLFNRFFEEQGAKVTPRECFAIIMIALKAQESDVFGDREIQEVAILTGLDAKTISDAANAFDKTNNNLISIIKVANTGLDNEQKICLALNALDVISSDGFINNDEKALFNKIVDGLEIELDKIEIFADAILLKNNRSIF